MCLATTMWNPKKPETGHAGALAGPAQSSAAPLSTDGLALPPTESSRAYTLLTLMLLALSTAFGAAGYRYYQAQKTEAESSTRSHLSAIADLKVQQILAWRRERPRDDRRLQPWLEDFRKLYGYSDVAVLDARGGGRIGGPEMGRPADRELFTTMAMARGNREAAASDLQQSGGSVHMDVVAPVLEPNGPGPPTGSPAGGGGRLPERHYSVLAHSQPDGGKHIGSDWSR